LKYVPVHTASSSFSPSPPPIPSRRSWNWHRPIYMISMLTLHELFCNLRGVRTLLGCRNLGRNFLCLIELGLQLLSCLIEIILPTSERFQVAAPDRVGNCLPNLELRVVLTVTPVFYNKFLRRLSVRHPCQHEAVVLRAFASHALLESKGQLFPNPHINFLRPFLIYNSALTNLYLFAPFSFTTSRLFLYVIGVHRLYFINKCDCF
jgi:hypothetical protein